MRRELIHSISLSGLDFGAIAEPSSYSFGEAAPGSTCLGVGIDCVERSRIAAAIAERPLWQKMCGPDELRSMTSLEAEAAVGLGARLFATKEALLKAIGPRQCGRISPSEVDIPAGPGSGSLKLGSSAARVLRELGVAWVEVVVAELPLVTVAVAGVGAAGSY